MPKRNSEIWDHFEKYVESEKIATCKYCKKNLSYKGTTTNLKTHLKLKHLSVYLDLTHVTHEEKRDNDLQSVSEEGKKIKFDISDEVIFKIIEKASPVIEGHPVSESSGPSESQPESLESNEPQVYISFSVPEKSHAATPPKFPPKEKSQPEQVSICEIENPNDMMDLKKRKMETELELTKEKLEIAKRERYKLDLELLKLERELNIQRPSLFTLPFHQRNFQTSDCHQNNRNIQCPNNHVISKIDIDNDPLNY